MADREHLDAQMAALDQVELDEWLEAYEWIAKTRGVDRARELLGELQCLAAGLGANPPNSGVTPYLNSIHRMSQPDYPGDKEIEDRIEALIRWNAMAMVVRANKIEDGIGGHISTFASAATLYDVAFNHFFRGRDHENGGDHIYFQGHASPGVYARAYLEGRLPEQKLENFRRELADGGGLSSYPHPWLMPDFWEFPTVSMGLGPIMSIYQARYVRYLENRGLLKPDSSKIWAFLGDGEMDEPESTGALWMAARESLDNLIFVVNCNLQRLDGPVRSNTKIIPQLEALFRGAGWNVIKVIWSGDWDDILAADTDGRLAGRWGRIPDGECQKYTVASGEYVREHLTGNDPRLIELLEPLSDEQLEKQRYGGHDRDKIYAAYQAAMAYRGGPTVILARTVKGWGMGESGEGKNVTHQQKKLDSDGIRFFRDRFNIPVSDEDVDKLPFLNVEDEPELKAYLHERRAVLGGPLPKRSVQSDPIQMPPDALFEEFHQGSGERELATTMVLVRFLSRLLRDDAIGDLIVPIIPDEARTFGMEGLFREFGIYSSHGQLYEPVDADTLLWYKEARDGQIMEEGITEAGAMSSFIAAGTAYANYGVNTIPFFIFYSMFGFQRIGDLIWAAGDMRCRGFLVGGTAGRTTLAGEGLQHQDGHSHLLAYPVPNVKAYDPAFGYEIGVIVQEGLRRMYVEGRSEFYYITVENEKYAMPAMPEGAEEGILRGIYRFRDANREGPKVRLFGSGAILNEVIAAAEWLEENHGIGAEVWSVTSYKELHHDALACDRWNLLHPEEDPKIPFIRQALGDEDHVIVASSDYVRALPESIGAWLPGTLITLGTDGFGRSESRDRLRDFFEVDRRYVALAALSGLSRKGEVDPKVVVDAMSTLNINPEKADPLTS